MGQRRSNRATSGKIPRRRTPAASLLRHTCHPSEEQPHRLSINSGTVGDAKSGQRPYLLTRHSTPGKCARFANIERSVKATLRKAVCPARASRHRCGSTLLNRLHKTTTAPTSDNGTSGNGIIPSTSSFAAPAGTIFKAPRPLRFRFLLIHSRDPWDFSPLVIFHPKVFVSDSSRLVLPSCWAICIWVSFSSLQLPASTPRVLFRLGDFITEYRCDRLSADSPSLNSQSQLRFVWRKIPSLNIFNTNSLRLALLSCSALCKSSDSRGSPTSSIVAPFTPSLCLKFFLELARTSNLQSILATIWICFVVSCRIGSVILYFDSLHSQCSSPLPSMHSSTRSRTPMDVFAMC